MKKKFIVKVIVSDNDEDSSLEDTVDSITKLVGEALSLHDIGYECLEVVEQ